MPLSSLWIKDLKIVIFRADLWKGTEQEPTKLYILYSRAEKRSSVSAKFYIFSAKWPCRGALWFFEAGFLGWILEGEFWEVNFWRVNFWGGLFCWRKQDQKIRPKNSGPKFGRSKFVSQNSAPTSGSGGVKCPVQKNLALRNSGPLRISSVHQTFSSVTW